MLIRKYKSMVEELYCQPKQEVIMGSFLKKNVNVDIGNDILSKPKKATKTFEKPKGCAYIREMFKKAEERSKGTTIEMTNSDFKKLVNVQHFIEREKRERKNEKFRCSFFNRKINFRESVISSNFAKIYFRELTILRISAQTNFREFGQYSRNSRKLIFAKINLREN